ncbi:hypothetical protein [Rubritalea tangerina]|uniref:hypothetical protein n=1 Tax=Rubritalea tangerina TaxID=430798 RepID=UPI00361BB4FC
MDRYRGTLIKPLRLHPDAVALLPPAGQRRDILLKTLRRIQSPPQNPPTFAGKIPPSKSPAQSATLSAG